MDVWLLIGLAAQLIFASRFVVQWLASEKRKKSHIPVTFWYLSIIGSLALLIYAIHRRDIVFTLGQGFSSFIYFRNLHLIYLRKYEKKKGLGDEFHRNRKLVQRLGISSLIVIIFIITPLTVITLNGMLTVKLSAGPIVGKEKFEQQYEVTASGAQLLDFSDNTATFWAYEAKPEIILRSKLSGKTSVDVIMKNASGDSLAVFARDDVVQLRSEFSNNIRFRLQIEPQQMVTLRNKTEDEYSVIVWTGFNMLYKHIDDVLVEIHRRNPDFVVFNTSFLEKIRNIDFKMFKAKLDLLGIPVYFVPGWNEYRKVPDAAFYEREFGPRQYSFVFKDTLFIVLDDSQKFMDKEQIDFLRNTLTDAKGENLTRKILFLYYWPYSEEEFQRKSHQEPASVPSLLTHGEVTDVFFVDGIEEGFAGETGTTLRRLSDKARQSSGTVQQEYIELSRIDNTFRITPHTFTSKNIKNEVLDKIVLMYNRLVYFAEIDLAGFILILVTIILWIAIVVLFIIKVLNKTRSNNSNHTA